MDIKDIFKNDLQMIEAVMNKMEMNEDQNFVEDNIIMCDLIIDTFSKIKNMYLEKLAEESRDL